MMNNAKITGGISHEECGSDVLVNPFVHRLELETTYEKIKVCSSRVLILLIIMSSPEVTPEFQINNP